MAGATGTEVTMAAIAPIGASRRAVLVSLAHTVALVTQ